MIQLIKKLFSKSPAPDYAAMLKSGGHILDVRTREEYASGHILGSINIPVQQLAGQLPKWDKKAPVITCCASGMRSASAVGILRSSGFAEVHNGGGWNSLKQKLAVRG